MTTDNPIEAQAAAAHAAAQQPAPAPAHESLWAKIHADVQHVGHVVGRLFPVVERIATNQTLDRLFEAAMMADDLGVEATIFQGVTDQLRAASARKAQPGSDVQVAITAPQPTAPVAATGPQPVITAALTDPGTAIQTPATSVFTPTA